MEYGITSRPFFQNISAAERIVNRILDDVDQLENHAEMGAKLSSKADVESDYRFLVTGSYSYFLPGAWQ